MNNYKYTLRKTSLFKKDMKNAIKSGCDVNLIDEVVDMLLRGETLPEKYQDHKLSGNFKGNRECHITPDWLLVYRIFKDTLILSLVRTGSHSEIFK